MRQCQGERLWAATSSVVHQEKRRGPVSPPPGALCPPFPAPSLPGLLESKALIPLCPPSLTLGLQLPPPGGFRAPPDPPVPLPGAERRKGHPRGSGTVSRGGGGATLSSGRGLSPSLPRKGKQVSTKKIKPRERVCGGQGVSPGGMLRGAQGVRGLRGGHAGDAPGG